MRVARFRICPHQERRRVIGRDAASPFAAIGVLSLGLIVPFGAGPLSGRAVAAVTATVLPPAKSVTLVRDGQPLSVQTNAATVDDLLVEQHVVRTPEDALSVDPSSALEDGETVTFRRAVPVTLVVDNVAQSVRSAAPTVGALLAERGIAFDRHDRLSAATDAVPAEDAVISVEHIDSWIERELKQISAPVKHVVTIDLPPGKTKVLKPGHPGQKELSYLVTRTDRLSEPRRGLVASRILRAPTARVVARGIGEYAAFAALAKRGFDGTLRLASAAMSMIATAYTANCSGCSGITATGRPAGHGLVAVDPSVIPLGTKLYIPGYGHALAADTGGAIHGNRIDLGFDSDADAFRFGRRSVQVYVLHQ